MMGDIINELRMIRDILSYHITIEDKRKRRFGFYLRRVEDAAVFRVGGEVHVAVDANPKQGCCYAATTSKYTANQLHLLTLQLHVLLVLQGSPLLVPTATSLTLLPNQSSPIFFNPSVHARLK